MTPLTNQQINGLVAEKVMGWRPGNLRSDQHWWFSDSGEAVTHVANFNPSEDPAAAKQVREKLAEQFTHWCLTWDSTLGQYAFRVWNAGVVFNAYGKTEELAQARCALKAHGIEL